jgi:hypothetical protein
MMITQVVRRAPQRFTISWNRHLDVGMQKAKGRNVVQLYEDLDFAYVPDCDYSKHNG